METFQLTAVFVILGLSFLFFFKEWLSPDLVAMGALSLCLVLGMLAPEDVADVFKNSAPITIGAMFILSAALTETGVIDRLARVYQKLARRSELRALVMLFIIVVPLSAVMNNTPVVVIFLPILIAFAKSASLKASRFLMPLSFFAILGGSITIFGSSTNILVAGVAQEAGISPIGVFEIAPLGLVYAMVGGLYLLTLGRKLIPNRDTVSSLMGNDENRSFYSTAMVPAGSVLIGQSLEKSMLWKKAGLRIFDIIRSGQRIFNVPLNTIVMKENDVVVLRASAQAVANIRESAELVFDDSEERATDKKMKLMEVMIGPQSRLAGETLGELRLRGQYGVVVAALHRSGENISEKLEQVVLELGDTLLVEGPEENMAHFLQNEEGLVVLNADLPQPYRTKKAFLAIGAILAVVTLATFGVSMMSAALVGAVFVMISGCVDPREAYRSIDWSILFIIFGMLGLGKAMENTGAAALIAGNAAELLEPYGPIAVLAMIYILASILTEVVTNNAVAILMTPIAIAIAQGMEVNPRGFVIAIIFGASASFVTPIGYQTNTYVFGAGGYRFTDFVKVGLPLNLLLWCVAVLLIPIIWPFEA